MTASTYSNVHIAPTSNHVEGVGSATFSSRNMYSAILLTPVLVQLVTGASWYYYLPLLLISAIPVFAAFHIISSKVNSPVRPQTGLPGKSIDHYMTMKSEKLARYSGRNKIEMETFFEAYFNQEIDIKDDLLATLESRYDWAVFTFTLRQAKFFVMQWVPETLWHSRKQDEDQVRDHYDRGDDFYNWFLGPMMIYTSGIMTSSTKYESLEVMQQKKLDTVVKKIGLKSGDKMLDIGCGWGTLSVHCAKQGADVTGVTLGKNQTAWANDKAREAKLSEKVKILCMDYRDIPKQSYDKITCLEMAEHVGVLRFSTFLGQVRDMLKDDGIFFLQIAGLRRAWQYEDLQWGVFATYQVIYGQICFSWCRCFNAIELGD